MPRVDRGTFGSVRGANGYLRDATATIAPPCSAASCLAIAKPTIVRATPRSHRRGTVLLRFGRQRRPNLSSTLKQTAQPPSKGQCFGGLDASGVQPTKALRRERPYLL